MQNLSYCTAAVNEVASLADKPNASGMTAAQLKAKFDASGAAIKEYINDALVPYVNSTMNPAIEDAAKTVADGTVTTEKLASGLVVPIANGGTGNTTGLAQAAKKLETARNLKVNLAAEWDCYFDGSDPNTHQIGVMNALPVSHGGTGATSAANAVSTFFPSSFSTPGYVCSMGSAGYSGGGGYTTLAQLKTALGTVSITKLWTNSSVASSFAEQTISLNLSGYSAVIVLACVSTSTQYSLAQLGVVGGATAILSFGWGDEKIIGHRTFNTTTTGVVIKGAFYNGVYNSSYLVPYIIYGVKGIV